MNANLAKIARIIVTVLIISTSIVLGLLRHKERTLRLSAQALSDRLAGELVVVHEKLDEARAEVKEQRARILKTEAEKKELEAKLSVAESQMSSMRAEMRQLASRSGGVDLGRVSVAAADAGAGASAATRGAVMSVNRDYNFVIVNLGSQNGIQLGMTLSLLQDGTPSSALRVDMVDETICAAAILGETVREIKVGDEVRIET